MSLSACVSCFVLWLRDIWSLSRVSKANRVFFNQKLKQFEKQTRPLCTKELLHPVMYKYRKTHTQRRSLWSFLSLLWRYFRDIRGYVIQFRRTLGVYCHLPPQKSFIHPPFFLSLSFPPTSKWACRRRTFVSPGRSHKHFEKKGIGNTFHLLHPNRGPIVCWKDFS